MARQFVVQLDNHPGELAHLARAIAARGINLHHVACVGAGSLACMFVTTDDDAGTRKVLSGLGHDFIEGRPIMVEVEDRPGGLADVSARGARARHVAPGRRLELGPGPTGPVPAGADPEGAV